MNKESIQLFLGRLKQRKEILIIAIPFGLALLFIVFYLIIAQTTKAPLTQNGQLPSNRTSIVPTVTFENLDIASTSPVNNAKTVDIQSTITVVFKKPLSLEEQKRVTLSTTPTTEGSQQWSEDRKTLILTPTTSLGTDTMYTVLFVSGEKRLSWIFQTESYENLTEEEIGKGEDAAAKYTKQQETELDTKYPWLESLPVQKPTYFAYFDLTKAKFVGLLYPKQSAASSIDAQVQSMQSEILTTLRGITTDVDRYGIEWKITPEP